MNDIKLTEEQVKAIQEFANNNTDDFEYIVLLSCSYYGWVTLSSGKIVYIHPPKHSAKEIGDAFKNLFNKIQQKDNKISKLLKQININLIDENFNQMRNISDILNEVSQKWNELK